MAANISGKGTIRVSIACFVEETRRFLSEDVRAAKDLCCVSVQNCAWEAPVIARLKPDVALIAAQLGEISGLEYIRRLKALLPELHILLVDDHGADNTLLEGICVGAHGYLVVPGDLNAVPEAIRAVHHLGYWFSEDTLNRLPGLLYKLFQHQPSVDKLTVRELETMQQVAAGKSNPEIATLFGIHENTIHTHLANIYLKLGVPNRTLAAVQYALARQWNPASVLIWPDSNPKMRPDYPKTARHSPNG